MADTQILDVRFNRIPQDVIERWKLVRDVVSGDQVLRTGEYLPTLNKSDTSLTNQARNDAYRKRAVWYPATGFTLEGFIGLAFRNDPTSEGIENKKGLEELLTNCDGGGVSLYQQSQATLSNVLQVGRHGLLADWSDAEQRGIIKSYIAESIINWRYKMEKGKSILSMIVLKESVEIEDGPWALKLIDQWREVFLSENDGLCYVRIWQENNKLTPVAGAVAQVTNSMTTPGVAIVPQVDSNGQKVDELQIRSRGKPFDFIPFTFIGSNNNDGTIDKSPLYGLASLNLAHFRNSADYEDSVFFAGQVQPVITGLDTEWRDHLENPKDDMGRPTGATLYVGSRTPILLPVGSTFTYAQAIGNTLAKEAMDQKEAQMVAVGARMIEANAGGTRTATEDENDKEATTSVLSMCVSNVNEGYQRAIWFCAQFLDMGEDWDAADSYKIQQNFVRAAADPAIIDSLVKQWQTGIIAKDDVRDYMRRVSLIPTERTNQEIEDDVKSEPPALGTLGAGTGIPGIPKPGISQQPPKTGKQQPPNKTAAAK